ncbi:MAG: shikimate dehydrogenase family protein [Sphingobacterium sp.]
MKKLGLIGYPLGHSFSKKYYLNKFKEQEIKDIDYDLYPIAEIAAFKQEILADNAFYGVNVTIPYKQSVIPYLDELSAEAKEMEAVNCIQIRQTKEGKTFTKGYNTDAYGFEMSLKPLLKPHHKRALVFGNGGATKAVCYSLRKLGISYQIVSRSKSQQTITYQELTPDLIKQHQVLINCSPLGTFPNITECPNIPYDGITSDHLLYDLIYNPEQTQFLTLGKQRGAMVKNGYEMLVLQAEKNWEIWNQ